MSEIEMSGAVFSSANTTLLLFVLFLDLLIFTSGWGLICRAASSDSAFTVFGSTTSRSKLQEQKKKVQVTEWYFKSHWYSDVISPWNINAGHPFLWLSMQPCKLLAKSILRASAGNCRCKEDAFRRYNIVLKCCKECKILTWGQIPF